MAVWAELECEYEQGGPHRIPQQLLSKWRHNHWPISHSFNTVDKMAAPRSGKLTACWTCRLRHKKCDGSYPTCETCHALDLPCHQGSTKPDWLDGGLSEQKMREKLKNTVTRSNKKRRGIGKMQVIAGAIFADEAIPSPRVRRTSPKSGSLSKKADNDALDEI